MTLGQEAGNVLGRIILFRHVQHPPRPNHTAEETRQQLPKLHVNVNDSSGGEVILTGQFSQELLGWSVPWYRLLQDEPFRGVCLFLLNRSKFMPS